MQSSSRTVARAGGPDLHVVEAGTTAGQSILFVHGYSQNCLSWREQFDSDLTDEFHLVAIDLRGHGRSEKPRGGYDDSDTWAGDIAAVVEELDLNSFVLVGWSYGSLVALDYLSTCGTERVAGVNLVGIVNGIGTARTNEWLGDGYVGLFPDIVSTDVETCTPELERLIDLCFGAELPPEDWYMLLGAGTVVPPHARDGMRDRTVSYLAFFETLRIPVLLTHGVHDAVVSVEAGRAADDLLPESELSEYDDGHSPFWESSDRFNRELRSFVADLPGSSSARSN